jgi:hypothetical protein
MKRIALACLVAFAPGLAAAADLPLKAPRPFALPLASSSQPLTMAGWSGFYGGIALTGTGTGVNIADLGSLTANGNAMGVEAGYETWNGMMLLGARAGAAYDMTNPGSAVSASFSDHTVWHTGVVFGGNLSMLFPNLPQPQFPTILMNTIPYVAIEGCGHRGMNGMCSSVGLEYLVPNSRLTGFVEYTNGQFGNTNGAPGQSTNSTDNSVRVGFNYHL